MVARQVGDETVVYDLSNDRVTHLDESASVVWALLDQPRGLAELAAAASMSVDDTSSAVLRLQQAGLLEQGGLSRRALLARAGAVAWTVPLVSIVAPTAAYAQSPACLPPDLSLTTLSLRASSVGRANVQVTASIAGLPTTCVCGDGLPKLEGIWQDGNTTVGSWEPLAGSLAGASSTTSSVTRALGQNGNKTFTFTLRVTCPGAESAAEWTCKRAALRVRRDGNSTNLQQAPGTPSGTDLCDTSPPSYP